MQSQLNSDKLITASLVLYNSPDAQVETILGCVEDSIIDKIYVYDNSPTDASRSVCSRYPKAEYHTHDNTGYGDTHNLGIIKAIEEGSTYHIVLNPDIIFTREAIDKLKSYMDANIDVAQIMPKVTYPDGSLQYLCKLLPDPFFMMLRRFFYKLPLVQKLNFKYELRFSGYDKIVNAPCLSGCFMYLRVSTLKENNIMFDRSFFMYFEDFDFVRRLHRVSKTVFYPYATVIHDHAAESYHNKKMFKIHMKSAFTYFNKYGWFIDKERKAMNAQVISELKQK